MEIAERGVIVSYETIRAWVVKFGAQIAAKIRRDRPDPATKWHLDCEPACNKGSGAYLVQVSAGQTEGQINRLKTLKRQMYGRANIELLKARLVAAS